MTQLTPTLYAVEVPRDAIKIELTENKTALSYFIGIETEFTLTDGFEQFKILGEVTKDEIGFDCEPCILNLGYNYVLNCFQYSNLNEPEKGFWTKEKAFRSLLQSKGLFFENPIEKPNCDCYTEYDREGCPDECWKWINNENKLIKGKLLILEKK